MTDNLEDKEKSQRKIFLISSKLIKIFGNEREIWLDNKIEFTPELEEKITNEVFTEIINRENKIGLKPVEVHFIEETIKSIFKKLKETLNV